MNKKFLILLFIFCIIPLGGVFAKECATLPNCDVYINGTKVSAEFRQFPFLQYKDIVYVPMTYYDCRFLGLFTDWNETTSTLEISKENITNAYRSYEWQWNNGKINEISICNFNIIINGRKIDNAKEKYPLITFRDVTYFPLTWAFAVDDFGWQYEYTNKDGLKISSDNYLTETLNLPDLGGSFGIACDDKYYYYTGNENKVYRTLIEDTSKNELIHTIPENYAGPITWVYFTNDSGNIYMQYHLGGATMGTTFRFRINSDGSVVKANPTNYRTSGIGYNLRVLEKDGVNVNIKDEGYVRSTGISYKSGDKYIDVKSDNMVFGEKRVKNKEEYSHADIVGNKIYTLGYNMNDEKNSSLFSIDTKTGKIAKILENVAEFYAISGWDTNANTMVDMVFYEQDMEFYRYSSFDGEIINISELYNLPKASLKKIIGTNPMYIVFEKDNSSYVMVSDAYGIGSLTGMKIFITDASVDYNEYAEILVAQVYSNDPTDDVHTVVFNKPYENFVTSDMVNNIFIHDNDLYYSIYEPYNAVVKVYLEK